jgi:RIP metalloprotease RseP
MISLFLTLFFFGFSIFIHELGHYLAAKRRGLFVPKFSIGFGPKLISWKIQETEFCISLLPLGGYVALPQLAELKAIEGIYSIPESHKRNLSAYDKILVALMGPMFNFLLALTLASILWIHGVPRFSNEMSTTVGYIFPHLPNPSGMISNPTLAAGLQPGDVILSVDECPVQHFEAIQQAICLGSGHDDQGQATAQLQIRRGDTVQSLTLHPIKIRLSGSASESFRSIGIIPASTLKISRIIADSPASQAGLQLGDQLLAIDGQKLYSLQQLQTYLQEHSSTVQMGIKRGEETITLPIKTSTIALTKPFWKLENKAGQELFCLIPRHLPASPQVNLSEITFEVGFSDTQGSSSSLLAPGDIWLAPPTAASRPFQDMEQFLSNCGGQTLLFQKSDGSICEYPLGEYDVHHVPETSVQRLGIECHPEMVWVHISPWQQIVNDIQQSYQTLRGLLSPHSDIAARHLMGPPGIFRTMNHLAAHNIWNLLVFLVMLNVNLAMINLLPLPVLDGGHILLAGLQKMAKNRIPMQWWYRGQAVFIFFLLGLMLYVSFHDIRRWTDDYRNRATVKFQEQIHFHS